MVSNSISSAMFLDSFPVHKRYLSATEVLHALQQREHFRIPLSSIILRRDMPIRQWLRTTGEFWPLTLMTELSMEYWSDISDMLNEQFDLEISDHAWFAVLTNPTATVGDLCDFIAKHAIIEMVPRVELIGPPDKAAGAFLALRERLRSGSGRAWDIDPSSPLPEKHSEVMLVDHGLACLTPSLQLRPQRVPLSPLEEKRMTVCWSALLLCFIFTLICFVLAFSLQMPFLVYFSMAGLGASVLCFLIACVLTARYDRWQWAGCRTFRDLLKHI